MLVNPTALVPSQDSFTAWTLVFYILETGDTEGGTEAWPQHGEAEDGTQPPGHHTGRGGGLCGDTHLTILTNHANSMTPQVWSWHLHYLDHRLHSWGVSWGVGSLWWRVGSFRVDKSSCFVLDCFVIGWRSILWIWHFLWLPVPGHFDNFQQTSQELLVVCCFVSL